MTKPLVIYHSPCIDGFTAAWVLKNSLSDCELFAAQYSYEPPDVKGRYVFMVDFSYKREVMLQLISEAEQIIHLDHHQSSLEDLKGLKGSNYTQIFDMKRSGAGLAWDYFHHDRPRPNLVDYVEDRDIWAWKLPKSKDINAYIGSYEMTFENWDMLRTYWDTDTMKCAGEAINRQVYRWIKEHAALATRYMVIGGWKVPVLNVPYYLASEAGHFLAQKDLERKNNPPRFAATYTDGPMDRKFSLRSVDDGGMDVAKIAEIYGGGGHYHASGFRTALNWDGK